MHGDRPDARALRARGADENLYVVANDISDPRRWRRVFRLMNGYGEWVQLSVFQCRLSRRRRIELKFALGEIIDHAQDHVVILDLGPPPVFGRASKVSASPSPWSSAGR